MTFEPGQEDFAGVCPYLGLADDADSHATYGTEAHRCYRLPTPTRIAQNHQETYCLGANHVTCPVYQGEGVSATTGAAAAGAATAGAPGPRRTPPPPPPPPAAAAGAAAGAPAGRPRGATAPARGEQGTLGPRPRPGGISMPVATIGLFALAVVVIALAFFISQALNDDGGDDRSPAAVVATNAALQTRNAGQNTQQPQATTSPGTAQAGSPSPAATGTPGTRTTTPGAGGGTYTVQSGDTCGSIAAAKGTTAQAIIAANPEIHSDCTNLGVGQVIKIP